ncbi:ABC transporter ATP-binding protein [Marinomonas agarivorans]|nr:ABC transporter ATP-binding protein [Marinomonas agarivorans]
MHSVSIKNLDLMFDQVPVLQNLNLDIEKGEFLVLLGSSGCGKSTLLNCIAGLLDVSAGQIWINDRNVTWEEPKDRDIGMVFQSYALYPQMTVEKNLSFGLRVKGVDKEEIARRVANAAKVLQIEALLQRKPAELSGGQRQRVAIGRALVRDVEVFLFDEPLSNLDAKLRADLRIEIKRLHQKLKNTMVYVTHDQVEALTLADRIAIMKNGVIQQLSSPDDIYHTPNNLFVAGFIGSPSMNFLHGSCENGVFTCQKTGHKDVVIDLSRYPFKEAMSKKTSMILGIRPEHLILVEQQQDVPFSVEVQVDIIEPMGSETVVWFELQGQSYALRLHTENHIQVGSTITIGFDPVKAHCFDSATEQRL